MQTLENGVALSRRPGDHVFGSLLLDYLGWIARRRKQYDQALSLQEGLRRRWTFWGQSGAANTSGPLAEPAVCLGRTREPLAGLALNTVGERYYEGRVTMRTTLVKYNDN